MWRNSLKGNFFLTVLTFMLMRRRLAIKILVLRGEEQHSCIYIYIYAFILKEYAEVDYATFLKDFFLCIL